LHQVGNSPFAGVACKAHQRKKLERNTDISPALPFQNSVSHSLAMAM
jgi:hypothetical protein